MMFPASDPSCLFCARSQHKTLCESERFAAIFDNFPVNPGHTLVVPKRHEPNYFDLSFEEMEEAWTLVARAQRLITAEFGPDGYNIGINEREAAGRTVPHAHIHLIPRHFGDTDEPRGGIRRGLPGGVPDRW